MAEQDVGEILGKLPGGSEKEIFRLAGMLTDPLTRDILAKLDSKHSPILTNDIPTGLLRAEKGKIMSRLYKLHKIGLLTSTPMKKGDGFCKEYAINEHGSSLVRKYMRSESKRYAEL